jgi:hypothetical protein
MGDNLSNYAGNKYYPWRELGFDSWADLLGLTEAQAKKLTAVRAFSGIDPTSGEKRIVFDAAFIDTGAITLTDYGAMDIGSRLLIKDSGTVRVAFKVAKSATAVNGDWYYEDLTVVT